MRWGRAAVTAQRRNHGQRPPGWEEQPGRPHLRALLAGQARVSTLTACGSQLCPAKLYLFRTTGKQSWTSSLSYRTLSRRESSRGLRTAGTEGGVLAARGPQPAPGLSLRQPGGLPTLRGLCTLAPQVICQLSKPCLSHSDHCLSQSPCFLVPLESKRLVPTTYPSKPCWMV